MEPLVSDKIIDDNDYLRFTLSNANVSIANALRRIILSEIPCVVFRTTPHDANVATIHINTSRMNNELIKQRISCIPIHITDVNFPIQDHVVELDVVNNTEEIIYATTGDFKIRNVESDSYLDQKAVAEIFPKDKITGDYIDIVRLRPKLSDVLAGEHIKLTLKFDIGTAKQDGAFNVVSTCAYAATPDKEEIEKAWNTIQKEMEGDNKSKEEIKSAEMDWRLLEGKRIVKLDSFDFVVETVGQFETDAIVRKAIDVMMQKIEKFKRDTVEKSLVSTSNTTIPNSYEIVLEGEDYTLGKVIEFVLYNDHYSRATNDKRPLNYCGFRKPHPHIDVSVIRIAFVEEARTLKDVEDLIQQVCDTASDIFSKIGNDFPDEEQ